MKIDWRIVGGGVFQGKLFLNLFEWNSQPKYQFEWNSQPKYQFEWNRLKKYQFEWNRLKKYQIIWYFSPKKKLFVSPIQGKKSMNKPFQNLNV